MQNIIRVEENFWTRYPELKNYWKDIFDKDKSKNKVDSSNFIKCLYYLYHHDSPFINLDIVERFEIVSNMFNIKVGISEFEVHKDKFYRLVENPARKCLREWFEKMNERSKFIKETPYSPDYEDEIELSDGTRKRVLVKGTHKMLDDMMKATEDIWESYWRIIEKINQEEDIQKGKSGSETSLTDKREI